MKKKARSDYASGDLLTTLHDLDSAGMVTISRPGGTLSPQHTERPMQNWIKITPAIIAVLAIALGSPVVAFAHTTRYDLLLTGGHVLDPANHMDGVRDVGVL